MNQINKSWEQKRKVEKRWGKFRKVFAMGEWGQVFCFELKRVFPSPFPHSQISRAPLRACKTQSYSKRSKNIKLRKTKIKKGKLKACSRKSFGIPPHRRQTGSLTSETTNYIYRLHQVIGTIFYPFQPFTLCNWGSYFVPNIKLWSVWVAVSNSIRLE